MADNGYGSAMDGSDTPTNAAGGSAASRLAYNLRDTASQLSLGLRKVEQLVASGQLDSFKVGKARRVTGQAIQDFIGRQQSATHPGGGAGTGPGGGSGTGPREQRVA